MLDLAHKYIFVLKPLSLAAKDTFAGYLLLAKLEEFVNGALEQIKRVERARRSMRASVDREQPKFPKAALARLFMDAHFYFICVGQVNKFLGQLCRFLKNAKLYKVHHDFRQEFSQEIRDHLEHLDERVVGRIRKGRGSKDADPKVVAAWKQDFVNFAGDKLSFGGKQYPVNAGAAKKLRGFHMQVIEIIREDYALKDRRFVEDEMRGKHLRKIMRQARKFYGQQKSPRQRSSRSKT